MKRAKKADGQMALNLEHPSKSKTQQPSKAAEPVYSIDGKRAELKDAEVRKHVTDLLKLVKHIK